MVNSILTNELTDQHHEEVDSILGYHDLGMNYGFLVDKTPQNVLDELKIQIDYTQNNFDKARNMGNQLVGEIEHEYSLDPQPLLKNYIQYLTQQLENEYQIAKSLFNYDISLEMGPLWVNFQQKYEHNPPHNHSGLYSFVIWYQIPFFLEDEKSRSYTKVENKYSNGQFVFLVPNIKKLHNKARYPIEQLRLDIDKRKEGYIAIFPSNLMHAVFPFYTSDEYRITVSGNIFYNKI